MYEPLNKKFTVSFIHVALSMSEIIRRVLLWLFFLRFNILFLRFTHVDVCSFRSFSLPSSNALNEQTTIYICTLMLMDTCGFFFFFRYLLLWTYSYENFVHIFWLTYIRCAAAVFMSYFSIISAFYFSLLSKYHSLSINLIRSLLSFSKIQILLCWYSYIFIFY